MKFDYSHSIDLQKSNDENAELFHHLREKLIEDDYIKIQCENIPNDRYDEMCLNLIESIGGQACPYGKDPQGLVWSVRVLVRDDDPTSVNLPGTNVDRELHFHTDCSYENHAPDYIALFVQQCDRTEHGGKFQLVRTEEILEKLSLKSQEILANETYKIIVRSTYQKDGNNFIHLPILLPNQRIRYQPDLLDRNQLANESIAKQKAINELNSILFNEKQLNIIRPNLNNHQMILFNNHRFLHGRTKILDLDRHLLRIRFNLLNQ